LGDVAYLLSPKDLVGLDAVPALAEIGVAGLKIEGRLKGPAYVATTVAHYRRAVDEATQEAAAPLASSPSSPRRAPLDLPLDEASLHVAYSRGISRGFLFGADHQTLVEGRFPRHRGLPLGRVLAVTGSVVTVVRDPAQRPITGGRALDGRDMDGRHADGRASDGRDSDGRDSDDRRTDGRRTDGRDSDDRSTDGRRADGRDADSDGADQAISVVRRAGMGVVFDRGRPEQAEQGGPIFGVETARDGEYRLRFGDPGPDLARVGVGDFVW